MPRDTDFLFFSFLLLILTGRDLPMQVCHWAPSQLAGCWVRTRCSWTTGASPPNVLWSSGNRLRLGDRPPRVILAAIPPTETETFVTHRRANDWNSEEKKQNEKVYFNAASRIRVRWLSDLLQAVEPLSKQMQRLLSVFLRRLNVRGRSARPATRVLYAVLSFSHSCWPHSPKIEHEWQQCRATVILSFLKVAIVVLVNRLVKRSIGSIAIVRNDQATGLRTAAGNFSSDTTRKWVTRPVWMHPPAFPMSG